MSQADRPSKRSRTVADADEPAHVPLKHHEEFWLDDGNVVLVAGTVGFRIYRGLLVAQSTVFNDMFASSSPHSDETIDGCPVVHVSDSPEDLAHLLRVLLPTTQRRCVSSCGLLSAVLTRNYVLDSFHREQDAPERTFDEVYAVITLAHKYNIEDVQRQALYSLREYTFNDNFEVWKERCREGIKVDGPCAIGAVNLARLLDVPQMLPIALYKCLRIGSSMLDGWTRGDGSIEHLSQDDIKRCIDALQSLSRDRVSYTYWMYYAGVSERCAQHALCKDALREILAYIMQCDPDFLSDGAYALENPIVPDMDDFGLCASCAQAVKDRELGERRTLWENLPDAFSLVVDKWGEGI
uniref:Xanthomonas outer protein J n=1 Tax=Ganoderma boninense TaxID=34458 RepID=A0A5K1K756_9APHY|nr:Xanthomonas outer protein J [Ganoderma boninense]